MATCLAQEDSDDEPGVASSAFEHVQKRLRVTSTTTESQDGNVDIILKVPKATDESDEIHALMWGTSATAPSDDETEGVKKRKGVSSTTVRNRRRREEGDGSSLAGASGNASEGKGGDGMWSSMMQPPANSRKLHQESKELDKIESTVLQAKQLTHLLQDHRSVMQVTVAKARSMLEKVEAKSTEDLFRMMLEMIQHYGPQCRAAQVMESLKDAKKTLEGIVLFVEALHDQEAACDTLRSRAGELKSLGVTLPRSVNMIMCRKSAEVLLNHGKLNDVFRFLDPINVNEFPAGIASVLPEDEDLGKLSPMIMEFQSGCITHCINQILLRDYSGDGWLALHWWVRTV